VPGICFWTHYGEHIDFLNTLSINSNSLTRCQRKPSPSQDDELTVVTSCCQYFHTKYLENLMFVVRVQKHIPGTPFSWALEHLFSQLNRYIIYMPQVPEPHQQ